MDLSWQASDPLWTNAWDNTARVMQSAVRSGKTLISTTEADSAYQQLVAPNEKGNTGNQQQDKGKDAHCTDLESKLTNVPRFKDQQIEVENERLKASNVTARPCSASVVHGDTRRELEEQIKTFKERDVVLHETIKDTQTLLKKSCKAMLNTCWTFWRTPVKGEEQTTRAAGSKAVRTHRAVEEHQQECSQSSKNCAQKSAVTSRCLQSRTGQHARLVGTTQRSGGKRRARSWRTAHRASCIRMHESGTITVYAHKLARQALG